MTDRNEGEEAVEKMLQVGKDNHLEQQVNVVSDKDGQTYMNIEGDSEINGRMLAGAISLIMNKDVKMREALIDGLSEQGIILSEPVSSIDEENIQDKFYLMTEIASKALNVENLVLMGTNADKSAIYEEFDRDSHERTNIPVVFTAVGNPALRAAMLKSVSELQYSDNAEFRDAWDHLEK